MAYEIKAMFYPYISWTTISNDDVITNSLTFNFCLFNNLKPTTSTCSFQLKTGASVINAFLGTNRDIKVLINKDSSLYFSGYVRNNFRIALNAQNKNYFDIECVDNSYKLKVKLPNNIYYINYTICNTSNTTTSIVHKLLSEVGISFTIATNIAITIPYFYANKGEEVGKIVTQILFEYGYVYYLNCDAMVFYPFICSSLTPVAELNESNCYEKFEITKKEIEIESVKVSYSNVETREDIIVFSDTTNGDAGNKANILVNTLSYYPTGADASKIVYSNFKIDNAEMLAVINPTLSVSKAESISIYRQNYELTRADIAFYNAGASQYIHKYDIIGDCLVKTGENYCTVEKISNSAKVENIKTDYIFDATYAGKLADYLACYYYYSNFKYILKTKETINVGDIVIITDNVLGLSNYGRVVSKKTTETYLPIYEIESVLEYVAGDYTSVIENSSNGLTINGQLMIKQLPTYTDLAGGAVIIGSNNATGDTTAPSVPNLT